MIKLGFILGIFLLADAHATPRRVPPVTPVHVGAECKCIKVDDGEIIDVYAENGTPINTVKACEASEKGAGCVNVQCYHQIIGKSSEDAEKSPCFSMEDFLSQ